MEPVPITIGMLARTIEWPSPDGNGNTTISGRTLAQVQALLNYMTNYIETQLERCSEEKNDAGN